VDARRLLEQSRKLIVQRQALAVSREQQQIDAQVRLSQGRLASPFV
jgi:hypothetical protein